MEKPLNDYSVGAVGQYLSVLCGDQECHQQCCRAAADWVNLLVSVQCYILCTLVYVYTWTVRMTFAQLEHCINRAHQLDTVM